jgi:hypothetical protein
MTKTELYEMVGMRAMTEQQLCALLCDALRRIMVEGLREGSFRQAMAALDAADAYQVAETASDWRYSAGEWRRDGAEAIYACSDGTYWLPSSRREFTNLADAMTAAEGDE